MENENRLDEAIRFALPFVTLSDSERQQLKARLLNVWRTLDNDWKRVPTLYEVKVVRNEYARLKKQGRFLCPLCEREEEFQGR